MSVDTIRREVMLKKSMRSMLIMAIGAATLAAAPANAGIVYTYYAPNSNGYILGYKVYNDCGALIYEIGYTSDLYDVQWVSIACG
jgi:hypothetical protein